MLQLIIENPAAPAALLVVIAGAFWTIARAIAVIAGAVAQLAPLFSGTVNRRAARLERAKHGKR